MAKERRLLLTRSDKFTLTLSATNTAWSQNKACTQNSGAKANQHLTTTIATLRTKSLTSSTSFQTPPNQHTTIPNTRQLRQPTNPREIPLWINKWYPTATLPSPRSENYIATFTRMRRLFTTAFNVNCWFARNVRSMVSTKIITSIHLKRLHLSWEKPFIL
jgi:hypothetical protein